MIYYGAIYSTDRERDITEYITASCDGAISHVKHRKDVSSYAKRNMLYLFPCVTDIFVCLFVKSRYVASHGNYLEWPNLNRALCTILNNWK